VGDPKLVKKVNDRLGRYHNIGKVLTEEVFGGFTQYVIDFGEEGIQRIKSDEVEIIKPLEDKLYEGNYNLKDFLLRIRASLMFNDDIKTGCLSRMKLDLIPHQIIMADKVTKTRSKGFLIADDVGLGKTIEAGLVIRSMIAHGRADRILLLCPANLAPQWREQLSERFDEWFDILRTEMNITDPRRWDNSPRIIASIQTLRLPKHRDILLESTLDWDLVIVDEAHHLTAREYASKIDKNKNYQLLDRLREKSKFFLFLTATPHQGEDDRFAMMLRLLDPDYIKNARDLDNIGLRINELIGRNIKADVTDFEGNKLFKGHEMKKHEVMPTEVYSSFLEELKQYVSDGLMSLNEKEGNRMSAENFVLTSFLKLAASSPEAIKRTLTKRFDNLKKGGKGKDIEMEHDERFEGEYEERSVSETKELFDGERKRIEVLLNGLKDSKDTKLEELFKILEKESVITDKDKRILIFTEYRGTQDMVKTNLESMFGEGSVLLINGDMDAHQKRKVVKEFDTEKRFLISTEAGGEGIDLHNNCHIMVNYDIPWNPMRLHQRTGRLDRYGQKEKVHVHYIVVNGTIDEKIQRFLEEKIERIEKRLCELKGNNAENLREDVLGQITLSRNDISKLYLSNNRVYEKKLESNIENAMESLKRHENIFQKIKGFDLKDFKKIESKYKMSDFEELIKQYLISMHKRMVEEGDGIVHFEIPDEIINMKVFRGRRLIKSNIRGTFDRVRSRISGIDLLGTGNEYIDAMLDRMIKKADSGNVLASRVHIDEGHMFQGKNGLLASFIVTSTPIVGGKQSFDGVDFSFYDPIDDRLYDSQEDMNVILSSICDERKHRILSVADIPDENKITNMIKEIEKAINEKIRDGRMGSVNMASIAWLEFHGNEIV